jgi:hypothetical protein
LPRLAGAWFLVFMNALTIDRFTRQAQAVALLGLPGLWLLMFALHFRSLADFFVFRLRYVPVPAADKVTRLIAAQNHWPMIHDPHMIGYISLPLLVLGAFGLHSLGRRSNPPLAALGISLTVIGCIYVGGVFGLFTALTRGLGDVDARFSEGAIATYAAVTADRGAYGLTRGLAELALLGIAVQGAALWQAPGIPRWSPASVIVGCALFLIFWDVDNLMFVGSVCMIAGFIPISRELRRFSAGA